MNKFKIGDWVIEKTTKKLKQIPQCKTENTEATLAMYERLCELWTPKEGEWCWFNMEFIDGWQNPVLMRYGEQDMSRWNMEPFVGNLPNFIKAKTK